MVKFKEIFAFKNKEIKQSFKSSKLLNKVFGLKLLKAPLYDNTKEFGKLLTVGSRKSGKAHERNLIRRRIKAIFYEEKLFENQNIFIILVYKEAKRFSFDQIKSFLVSSIKPKQPK